MLGTEVFNFVKKICTNNNYFDNGAVCVCVLEDKILFKINYTYILVTGCHMW